MIGGDTAAEGNLIANSALWGVAIWGDLTTGAIPVNNSILHNRIFNSGDMGIDLRPIPTFLPIDANDPGDTDDGPNNLLNHPDLLSAVSAGGTTTVMAQIADGLPDTFFRVQFFSNPACDAVGVGEGEVYLGEATIITDASGNFSFGVVLPMSVTVGHVITSTAT